MRVKNKEIAEIFKRLGDLLDIKGENSFQIRAYRHAAQIIGGLSYNLRDMVNAGESLTNLSGVDNDLAKKIQTIVRTGSLPQLRELEKEVPVELIRLMQLPDMGPKRVKVLYNALKIKSFADLMYAVEHQKIRELEGFSMVTEKKILKAIESWVSQRNRPVFLIKAGQN